MGLEKDIHSVDTRNFRGYVTGQEMYISRARQKQKTAEPSQLDLAIDAAQDRGTYCCLTAALVFAGSLSLFSYGIYQLYEFLN